MTSKILVLGFKINSSQKIGQKLHLKDTYLALDNNFLRLNKLGLEKKNVQFVSHNEMMKLKFSYVCKILY